MKSLDYFSKINIGCLSFRILTILIIYLCGVQILFSAPVLGPLVGELTSNSVKIWVKSAEPEKIIFTVFDDKKSFSQEVVSLSSNNNTAIVTFSDLTVGQEYKYRAESASIDFSGTFKTLDIIGSYETKIAFGACYDQTSINIEKGQIFKSILSYQPDLMVITGDFPYSKFGGLDELRRGHDLIRKNKNFQKLTSSTPTIAIWDDHDFGINNADGNNPSKIQALAAFREYWPNPINEDKLVEGIYSKHTINNIELFLLDTRFYSNQSPSDAVLLGKKQDQWLCNNLQSSRSTYKVIVSGVALSSTNADGWSGSFFKPDKERLLSCIYDNRISGVLFVSGDLHRAEVHKHALNSNPFLLKRFIYDFSVSPLNAVTLMVAENVGESLIYANDNYESMFGALEFIESDNSSDVLIFRLFDAMQNELKQIILQNKDLNLDWRNTKKTELDLVAIVYLVIATIGSLLLLFVVYYLSMRRFSKT